MKIKKTLALVASAVMLTTSLIGCGSLKGGGTFRPMFRYQFKGLETNAAGKEVPVCTDLGIAKKNLQFST